MKASGLTASHKNTFFQEDTNMKFRRIAVSLAASLFCFAGSMSALAATANASAGINALKIELNTQGSVTYNYFQRPSSSAAGSTLDSTGPNFGWKVNDVLQSSYGVDMSNSGWSIVRENGSFGIYWSDGQVAGQEVGATLGDVTYSSTTDAALMDGAASVTEKVVDGKHVMQLIDTNTFVPNSPSPVVEEEETEVPSLPPLLLQGERGLATETILDEDTPLAAAPGSAAHADNVMRISAILG